jgi:hypothetical protein
MSELVEDDTLQYASEKTSAVYGGTKDVQFRGSISEASGYLRKKRMILCFKTALTVDISSYNEKGCKTVWLEHQPLQDLYIKSRRQILNR